MKNKDIALLIQNLTQFYSIKNGLDNLIRLGYSVDVYIPKGIDDSGMGDIFNDTFKQLKSMGYTPLREPLTSINYSILLEPYCMDNYFKFKYKYRLKYKYSLLSAKPNLVYTPEANIIYDAILCFSKYDAEFLKAYSKTELIGNLKYLNFSKTHNRSFNKPTLLYLPTYGDVSSIEEVCTELQKLKSKYNIIIKLHHGTTFLKNESHRVPITKNIADECYDYTTPLIDLLQLADVVLSDNSGAIFESLYAKVPLAICSKDINANKLDDFDTIQYKLVENDIIPFSESPSKIETILDQALSDEYIKKQIKISNDLFYYPENILDDFINVIEKYLNDNIDLDYKKLHDNLIKDFSNKKFIINNLTNEILSKNSTIDNLNSELSTVNNKLSEATALLKNAENMLEINQKELEICRKNLKYYEDGKLYKLCKKIYKIKNKE